jgi:hypothetical protein
MMIIPIDRYVNEAQHIGQEARSDCRKCLPIGAMRHMKFQHHDGDDDGDDAVAERGKTIFAHGDLTSPAL